MEERLFPIAPPTSEWVGFSAAGFSKPVNGVIYRANCPPCCGVPLGGISTGCLDIDSSGVIGFCTIFNSFVPRQKPRYLPLLGLFLGGKTWMLTSQKIINGGTFQGCTEPRAKKEERQVELPKIEGVECAKEIHYWGHYPVADLEYEIDVPVSVGLRAWAPFIPGDIAASSIPGAIFEVHLRNTSDAPQYGTIAISFPGPTEEEVDTKLAGL